MRIKFTFIFFLAFIQASFSQIVTTNPLLPTQEDSIIVYFDATQPGASELLNYTGTVYAHTGVTTNLGQWQHVIGTWGNNSTQPALTRLGNNLYKLTIGFPRKFYNVTNSSEQIKQLDFVFRSSDGTKQTRPDIFTDLFTSGLNVKVVSPVAPYFTNLNDTVSVEISSLNAKSVSIFVNNSLLAQTLSSDTTFKLIANSYGDTWIKAVATDSNGFTISDSSYFVVDPAVTIQAEPSGIVDGINYLSNSSVILSLYAPYKKNVYVIGDFNNWVVDQNYYMKQTPDGNRWWIEIDNLTPQKEYIFQYLVDGSIRIADPYSEKISDPNFDQYISDSTYPNLIKYPVGKTTQIATVIETGQVPYLWHDSSFVRPIKSKLVIYELLMRDFLASHDYKTLTDTLTYLKSLGINAIELMPIMNFEGNNSWGYNPNFFDAPAKYYGPKNDLKKFIDVAHQSGIAVILDIPFNDAFGSCPLVRLYWDSTNNVPAANNPWFNQYPTHPFNVGYDFNHTSPATQYYVDATTKFWLTQYHVDGFRFDLAGGYTQTYNPNNVSAWQSFDQSRINNQERIANAVWKVDSTAYVILEEFVANNEENIVTNYGMLVWDNMSSSYQQASMGYATNPSWDLSGISYKAWGWSIPGLVGYMESHDEERLMYKNLNWGNSSGTYNIKDLATALNRIKLCEAFFYTIPGSKMLWEFQELGYDYSINYDPGLNNGAGGVPLPYPETDYARTYPKPIRWDYFNDPRRMSLYKVTKAFINLKLNNNVFNTTNFNTNLAGAIKTIVLSSDSQNVVVIGNFDVDTLSASTSIFPFTGTWYDYFSGQSVNITASPVQLGPGEFHIYTSTKIATPDTSVITDVKEMDKTGIKTFNLEQNYPNPFNPGTIIQYSIPRTGKVVLKIYDVMGRVVATLVNGIQAAGKYNVEFNASKYSSGVYFYRLQSGDFVSIKKMILLK
jgi:glycosidase